MGKQRDIPGVLKRHWRLSMWSGIMLAALTFTAEIAITASLGLALSLLLVLGVWGTIVTYLVGNLADMMASR
jgi:hypothetical protein